MSCCDVCPPRFDMSTICYYSFMLVDQFPEQSEGVTISGWDQELDIHSYIHQP